MVVHKKRKTEASVSFYYTTHLFTALRSVVDSAQVSKKKDSKRHKYFFVFFKMHIRWMREKLEKTNVLRMKNKVKKLHV